MTKTEFKREAAKAGIQPELYGAVLSGQLYCNNGCSVSGGKIVGIEWREEWQTEQRFSHWRGEYTEKYLGKSPYVVLTKNKEKYRVEAWKVSQYVDKVISKLLAEKIKAGNPL